MWITQGIQRSIQYRDKLYKQLKLTHPNFSNYEIINVNLKTYNTILQHTIREAKSPFHTGFNTKVAKKYSYYLNKNVTSTFTFEHIDEETVWKTINNLPTKTAVDLMVSQQNYSK